LRIGDFPRLDFFVNGKIQKARLFLKYEHFNKPTALSAATDAPTVPEQFRQVIVDGATAYAYQYRGEAQQYGINFKRFEDGIKHMQSILLNRTDYVRSTYIPHSQRYGINIAAF
jgi:hypothetical protein